MTFSEVVSEVFDQVWWIWYDEHFLLIIGDEPALRADIFGGKPLPLQKLLVHDHCFHASLDSRL